MRRTVGIGCWVVLWAAVGCARQAPSLPGFQGIVELEARDLGFEEPGRISAVAVARGDVFAKGAELARLDDAIAHAMRDARAAEVRAARAQAAQLRAGARREDVRGAEAQYRAAQQQIEKLERNWDEQQSLLARGVTGASAVKDLVDEVARARQEARALSEHVQLLRSGARPEELDAADARVAGAEAALTVESQRLAHRVLSADQPGTVIDVLARPGEVVGAATPVITVADTAHPYVDVFVPTAELPGVAVGQPAEVRIDGLAGAVPGTVEHLGQATEFTPKFLFSTRERPHLVVRVRVRLDDPERRLRAGVPAFVTFGRPR